VHTEAGSSLHRGLDQSKDQAYFLWGLPADLVPNLDFPLGALTKSEVRRRARTLGLVTADKPESQEICFVPTGDYRSLLRRRLGPHPALEPGPIVNASGEVVGEHPGYAGYTVGQRKGLGGGFSEPYFVLEVRAETREVVVGTREELFRDEVHVGGLNWLGDRVESGASVRVQLRYRAPAVPAKVFWEEDGLVLHLQEPQAAITPGQSAALYEGDRLLGGGRIAGARITAAA
jgi:tRNA-specific 2-thiouridylase